jgi:hypothetical protein
MADRAKLFNDAREVFPINAKRIVRLTSLLPSLPPAGRS